MHWAKKLLNKINILILIFFTFNNPQKTHLTAIQTQKPLRVPRKMTFRAIQQNLSFDM